MAAHIEVILRNDVENLGKSGEVVRVRPGYARNYLIPRGLAALATRATVAQIEHEKKVAQARAAKQRADAEAFAKQLSEVTVDIPVKVGEGDKLFGSVGSKDIAEALARKGLTVDRKKIVLPENIRTLGEHPVTIKLGSDIKATVKVNVVRAA
jgi:large subunit ribosomal protein L9